MYSEEWMLHLRSALVDAFPTGRALENLAFEMGENLQAICTPGTVPDMAREFVVWARVNNKKALLLTTALRLVPGNRALQEHVALYSLSEAVETKQSRVLLVTATEVETQALLLACEQATQQPFTRKFFEEGSNVYHDLHTIGGAHIFEVQSETGTQGASGAMLTIEEGIRLLSPVAVLLVGIAFGMQEKKQRMGDILVSRQILEYERQRVGKTETLVRGDRPQASPRLLARVRSATLDWKGPDVHFGLLLSGEKVLDHLELREQLRKLEPEAIGGEMEGAGLYGAALRKRTDWIVIKAICDWADGKKGYRKEQRQPTAAENAAQFVVHILQQGSW